MSPVGDPAGGRALFVINSDGSGLRQLTHFPPTGNVHELGFAPDAKSIVFSKGGATGDLFVMRANGTGIRQITQTELSENWPDWGPGRAH
jgi:Tol biopolymer transport system component